jgi:hypothetical protein
MFRMGLLTSTAMTAVALLLSGAPDEAYAQTRMDVAGRDANARFLCTYGQFRVSAFTSEGSGYFVSAWVRVAVPVTGHGQTVRRIRVIEAQGSALSNSAFSAGIYSNTPSGFPGLLIAGGKGQIGPTCGPVMISIPPTTLMPNTKYWIEETAHARDSSSSTVVNWEANPNTKHKAYVQDHRFFVSSGCSCSSSYTSPWTKQAKGPYFKLK